MKVYEATVYDKCDNDGMSYESHIAIANDLEEYDMHIKDYGITDDDVHFVFLPHDNVEGKSEIETDEFKYLIGKEIIKDGED